MRLRHNIPVFFSAIYASLFLVTFAIVHATQSTLLAKYGNMLGVIMFVIAVQLSSFPWTSRFPSLTGLSPIGLKHFIAQKWLNLSCTIGVLAVAIQTIGYGLASHLFRNQAAMPDVARLALLVFVHTCFAAVVLNWERLRGTQRGPS